MRYGWAVAFLVMVWLAPLVALAQEVEGEEKEKGKSYVLGYALTTLCIGLGIFIMVRPAKRRYPKIKRKDDEDDVKPKGH
jgi:hypothetical protein